MKKLILTSFFLIFVIFTFDLQFVHADSAKNLFSQSMETTAAETGHSSDINIFELIGKMVGILLSFIGVIFLALMIYGGYIWMIAQGNEQQVDKAQNIIKMAVKGIFIVLAAYTITVLVGNILK